MAERKCVSELLKLGHCRCPLSCSFSYRTFAGFSDQKSWHDFSTPFSELNGGYLLRFSLPLYPVLCHFDQNCINHCGSLESNTWSIRATFVQIWFDAHVPMLYNNNTIWKVHFESRGHAPSLFKQLHQPRMVRSAVCGNPKSIWRVGFSNNGIFTGKIGSVFVDCRSEWGAHANWILSASVVCEDSSRKLLPFAAVQLYGCRSSKQKRALHHFLIASFAFHLVWTVVWLLFFLATNRFSSSKWYQQNWTYCSVPSPWRTIPERDKRNNPISEEQCTFSNDNILELFEKHKREALFHFGPQYKHHIQSLLPVEYIFSFTCEHSRRLHKRFIRPFVS